MSEPGSGCKIAGVGVNVPSRVLTNFDLEKMVDTSDEWIVTRTGIRERRIADADETTHGLAIPAAQEALRSAGIEARDLDLIICATATQQRYFPSTACMIGHGLGAGDAPGFDISAACSGFIYGSSIIQQYFRGGMAKNALLVASEIYSRIVNWQDRATCVLFGDAAAAVVFSASDSSEGLIATRIRSNGEYGSFLTGGAITRSGDPVAGALPTMGDGYFIEMKGNQTFKIAVKSMCDVATRILEENGMTVADVDMVIPHQANIRIISAVGKSLGLPEDKVYSNIHRYGNTSAATIPLALYEAVQEGRVKKGDVVLMVAFGGGLTWGASLMRW
ncbi:MAG: ketoacyl-ACP synthase III [Nitrospinota bacterium]|nr:ketoacyl-ACP synthase III [Nitrospinota bacterium]